MDDDDLRPVDGPTPPGDPTAGISSVGGMDVDPIGADGSSVDTSQSKRAVDVTDPVGLDELLVSSCPLDRR